MILPESRPLLEFFFSNKVRDIDLFLAWVKAFLFPGSFFFQKALSPSTAMAAPRKVFLVIRKLGDCVKTSPPSRF